MSELGPLRETKAGMWQARILLPPHLRPHGTKRSAWYVKGPRTFRTKKEARKWQVDKLAEINAGEWERPEVQAEREARERAEAASAAYTLGQWAEEWHARIKVELAPGTVRTYWSKIRAHVLPYLADVPLRSLTRQDLREWYSYLADEKHLSAQNLQGVYRALSTMLTYAENEGLIDTAPRVHGATKKLPTKRQKVEQVATPGEVQALIEYSDPWIGVAVMLAAECALRWEECAALTRADLIVTGSDPRVVISKATSRAEDGKEVLGPTKSVASNREIPIPTHRLPMLRDHLANHVEPEQDALIVHAERAPRSYMSNDKMHRGRTRYNQARTRAGLPESFRFHDLRVTCLTRIGQAGATLAELMRYAGHSDPKTVMRYQVAEAQRLRRLAESMHQGPEENNVIDLALASAQ